MDNDRKPTRIRVAGLWKNEKDGKEYLSGNWGGARILIFPNGYKEGKQPDYYLYLVQRPPPAKPEDSETY